MKRIESTTPCALCGMPVARPQPGPDGKAFCCRGCRSAYEICLAAGELPVASGSDRIFEGSNEQKRQ